MSEDVTHPPESGTLIYHLRDVVKTRESEGVAFRLNVPSLQIAQGEKIALIGESGCGKSTLLDMLSFILQPSDVGSFRFRPQDKNEKKKRKLIKKSDEAIDIKRYWDKGKQNTLGDLRRRHIGYVMQTGGLLPYLSVKDNINLTRSVLGMKDDGTVDRLAKELGIHHHLKKLPEDLSTGERQRVAIGRALAHNPSIVIADEPTASVDPFAAEKIMSLFLELVEEMHITVIVASHAWQHIKRLELRRLSHHTRRSDDGHATETVVKG